MCWNVSLAVFLLVSVTAPAETVRVPIVADTSICAYPDEREFAPGGCPRLKLKGNENLILIDFDVEALRGRRIGSAVLRLKEAEPNLMVRRVGLSTLATGWVEGTSGTYAPGDGACFMRRGPGKGAAWAGAESVLLDTIFGRAGTLWVQAVATRGPDGWWSIPVDPRLLEAHAANISAGLALSDDCGQTMNVRREVVPESNMSNNWFFSREQSGAAPVLEAELEPAEAPPGAGRLEINVAEWPAGATPGTGGIEVAWPGPASDAEAASILGYRVWITVGDAKAALLPRWMYPPIPPPGEAARILIPNLPAGGPIIAEVEVVGRAGRSVARGQGGGFASRAMTWPDPLVLPRRAPPPAVLPPRGSVWVIPEGTKVNPVTGNALEEPDVEYAGAAGGTWRDANPAWDGARRSVALAGIRGEWVAFQVVVEHRGEGAASWRIVPGDLVGPRGPSGPGGAAIPASAVRLSRLAYLRIGSAWYGDPLVPLKAGDSFRIPAEPHAFPEQANQTVYVELRVPEAAKPGRYTGRLEVKPDHGKSVPISLTLEVASAVMPREAHFVWSMNAYSSPGPRAERAYYALAHDHRTNLAILHYSHSANYEPGCVPPVKGRGASARVADWSEWDERFGPLFDGSAFAGTSRAGIGLDHFYLALSEHYPVPMREGYKWNDVRWEDHWRIAGPVEEGFSREMQETWVAVAKDYLAHIKAKGWKTQFQVYLNDKYYYKQYDQRRKAWGNGVSFWLLDEPNHADDFLALGFFGRLLRRAQREQGSPGDRTRVVFRTDVSQPHWGRDILDRVTDVNVTGGWPGHRALLEGWRALHGQRIWTYGDTPPAAMSALALSAQAMSLWADGIDGYVPWLVLGEDRNWTEFASTSVIYPGAPAGVDGPCASLRLKAYRRAEQDVEYVWLYAGKRGWLKDDPFRRRIRALLSEALKFNRTFGFLDSEGAQTESITGVSPAALDSLRSALRAGL